MHLVNIPISSSAKLYLGQAPGNSFIFVDEAAEIDALRGRVDVAVVLQTTGELTWSVPDLFDLYYDAGIRVMHYPIRDLGVPKSQESLDRLVNGILHLLSNRKNVLIHCFGGKGRTGLVAAALLIKSKKLTAQQAIAYIRSVRPGSIETPQQERFLQAYQRMIRHA